MKLKEAKEQRNILKLNLNKVLRGRFKSEEQKSALESIELLSKSREAAIKLVNDYSSVVSEAKHKAK